MTKIYNPNGMKICLNCKHHAVMADSDSSCGINVLCKAPQLKLREDSKGVSAGNQRGRFSSAFQEETHGKMFKEVCGRKGNWYEEKV